MRNLTILICGLALFFGSIIPAFTADPQGKKKKTIIIDGNKVTVPDIDVDVDMRALEDALEEMEYQLNNKAIHLEGLDEHLRVLENIEIEMPDMDELAYSLRGLEALENIEPVIMESIVIPPIPPINIQIPQMDFDFRYDYDGAMSVVDLMDDLSDSEELRLQAMRSIVRQDADAAIPALEKTIRHDSSPALRYQAVRYLSRFLDDGRTTALLGEVVENDRHVKVRKKAIQVLGKSNDPRAVEILEEIIKR